MKAIQECTYKTKGFVLGAALHAEPELLSLSLEDLQNGASYKRDYREEDVGKQISGKVDL